MIIVPQEFSRWRTQSDGEAGRAWVASLPDVVRDLCLQWGLVVEDDRVRHGALALVVPVRRGQQRCVLKVSWHKHSTAEEATALRAWGGRGVVQPVPGRWVAAARENALALSERDTATLVHADLHYGNVLAGQREPWLAIDPRALRGDPEFSVPELMWTRADDLPDAQAVHRLLAALTEAAGLDASVAHGWVVTRCVDYWLWALEHGLTIDPVRCERILTAMLP